MAPEFVTLTEENLADEHLCCIIRSRTRHPGVEAKRDWLAQRIPEGHVFRKLKCKGTVFIEYAPLEKAWVPIVGENYFYLYCLWVAGEFRGKGYARALMESCIAHARSEGKSGICMLGAKKQKAWLSDQSFAEGFGFRPVESTQSGYELLALSFDGTTPTFSPSVRQGEIPGQELTVFYDDQCPFIVPALKKLCDYCTAREIPLTLNRVDSLQKAKALPCVFNNWALFYKGQFVTVNLADPAAVGRLLKR